MNYVVVRARIYPPGISRVPILNPEKNVKAATKMAAAFTGVLL